MRKGTAAAPPTHSPPTPGGTHTWDARAELVREFRDEVVVDAVFHGTQDNHGARVADWKTETGPAASG